MYNCLNTLSKIFYVCSGVFLAFALVVIRNVVRFDMWIFPENRFADLCVILYTITVPGIFLCLGIALHKINQALFDETLSRISQSTDKNT